MVKIERLILCTMRRKTGFRNNPYQVHDPNQVHDSSDLYSRKNILHWLIISKV